jgi:membrane protease YdiL (CAAX protease family)
MPLILFTSLYHADGNRLLVLPLFVGTVVIAGVLIGYLRIASGSIWPATLAHSAHNAAWGLTGGFMIATSPAAEEYVAGDTGIVIAIGTGLALWALVATTRRGLDRRLAPHALEASGSTA